MNCEEGKSRVLTSMGIVFSLVCVFPITEYASAQGIFTTTGSLATARFGHTATLLPDGKVLVAGGQVYYPNCRATASTELYDPSNGVWVFTGSMNTPRYDFTATLLPYGKVLAAGGAVCNAGTNTAELYDPATSAWTTTGSMHLARWLHRALLLPNGLVLVAAGMDTIGRPFSSAELYIPPTPPAPLASAGPDQVVSAGPNCQAAVTLDGTGSSDPNGDPLTYTWTEPVGTATGPTPTVTLPKGVHTITLTVNDGRGGTATDTVVVTVRGVTPPVFTLVPGPIMAEQTSPAGASVSVALPTATDNCGFVTVVSDALAIFPSGTTTVTFTATDFDGNSARATTTVTVRDTTPPTATLSLSPTTLWPPNHKMITITPTLTASDVAGQVTISGPAITSNEPVDGLGDGDTSPDWVVNGTNGIQLRAERSGKADGRVYTVTYTVIDQAGNTRVVSATVTVPKSQGK